MRQFADQVLAHGRDTYGKPTPLFVDGINVDTREPVKWKWADGKEWVLCNLASQQGLFRTLDGLSRLTGEPRYKDAALEALRYAFDHLRYGTQNNGGLLAWGGHLVYNATDDVIVGNPDGSGRVHELKCFFPHYELMWEANPQATRQLIENMWNGHVLNWANLDFNRHASPKKLGALWQNEYRGGEVFFDGQGLTFHNAGSDFYFAAGCSRSSPARRSLWFGPNAWRIVTSRPATPKPGWADTSSASAGRRGVTTWARSAATVRSTSTATTSRATAWSKARCFPAMATRRKWSPRWAACCWGTSWARRAGTSPGGWSRN